MATASAPRNPIGNWEKLRDEWVSRLSALVDTVESWSREFGWVTRRLEKRLEKDAEAGKAAE